MNPRVDELAAADLLEIVRWLARKGRQGVVRNVWLFWSEGLRAIAADPRRFAEVEGVPPGIEAGAETRAFCKAHGIELDGPSHLRETRVGGPTSVDCTHPKPGADDDRC